MLLFFEFFIYMIFVSLKLYSLCDFLFLHTKQGSKLENYMKTKKLPDITCNLSRPDKVFILRSLTWYKKLTIIFLVSSFIFILKIIISFDLLVSNKYYLDIIFKTIELKSAFGIYFTYFKFIYYISFYFCTIYLVKYILNNISIKNKKFDFDTNKGKFEIGKLDNGEGVYISKLGLYQNVLVTGSIGSGKTSSFITNAIDYLFSEKIFGLVLDVKGNYVTTVNKVALKHGLNSNMIEISLESQFNYNPIDKPNVKSIEIAHSIRKVLTLLSDTNNSDSFWLDKVEMYLKDFINIIRGYKEYVDFSEIHKLVIDKEYLNEKLELLKNNIVKNIYNENTLFELNSSIVNIKNEYLTLDDRTASIIKSEITRITDIFVSDYNINKKFCSKSDLLDFKSNKIYVLSISTSQNRKLAKIIATYLKLDFQTQILNDNKKTVFFICDEYQEFVNSQDCNFFSLSREYKCINIISMQSYSSLVHSLNNQNASKVIIQNFVNKIWFRNDDIYTIEEIVKQIGKEEKEKISFTVNESSKETKYNLISKRFKGIKSNLSQGYTINKVNENILDLNYFSMSLKSFQVAALISNGEKNTLYKKVNLRMWG